MDPIRKSKLLSLVLRHRPELVGISLDEAGWTDVADLLAALGRHGEPTSLAELESIVAECSKQRFAFDADQRRIRANQGHSVPVALGLDPVSPPAALYHGTATRFLASIRRQGLRRGRRHHVHLNPDPEAAAAVGRRRGTAAVLTVDAAAMHGDGYLFYVSANGVWLTERVPPQYLRGLDDGRSAASAGE